MVVYRKAIGLFPATPALDDSWRLTHEDPPPVGQTVEVCWAQRKTPESEPEYHCSTASIKKHSTCLTGPGTHGHTWLNHRGEMLLIGPAFWRPLQEGGA